MMMMTMMMMTMMMMMNASSTACFLFLLHTGEPTRPVSAITEGAEDTCAAAAANTA